MGLPRLAWLNRLAIIGFAISASAADGHPLDPLSADEIGAVVSVLAASGRTDRTTRVASVTLLEPPKAAVITWSPGVLPPPRKALAILRVKRETVEAVVDIDRRGLDRWTPVPGAQTAIQSTEWRAAQPAVIADDRWREAMAKRGVTEFDDIFCESLSAGNFGLAEEIGRRLLKMPCYDTSGGGVNAYARPIEGVIATVDLDSMQVLDVSDHGVRPVGKDSHDFTAASDPVQAVENSELQPFEVDGRTVRWRDWSFHLGFDQRFGPVLSSVRFRDGGAYRSVLYQGHVSEVFVPYMDPAPGWAYRTYIDAGEFGLGALTSSLAPGVDCPRSAMFLAAILTAPSGKPYARERAICIFERETAAPLWRHAESLNGAYAGKSARELVVRSIPSVAHYDYVVDWVFGPSGDVKVRIGATGIDAVKASPSASGPYGQVVAPGLVAVNHDHFFSVRLDLDVDGAANGFRRGRIKLEQLPPDRRRRSFWRLQQDPIEREGPLAFGDGPQIWSVASAAKRNAYGGSTAYQIVRNGPVSILSDKDPPQRRAMFARSPLWLTARRQNELHAAGPYPNQAAGGGGLPEYANGEPLKDADIVIWPTIGFRHVTRPEDWPVLSTVWQEIHLRPFGFFDRNPSVK